MSPQELWRLTDQLCRTHFGCPYEGRVEFSDRMRTAAGRIFLSNPPLIRISRPYHARFGPEELINTLKHELCHYVLARRGHPREGHGPRFVALARQVGAPLRAKDAGLSEPYRHVYECPACGRRRLYRRRVDVACRPCCDRHNGGRYTRRFALRLVGRALPRSSTEEGEAGRA